MMAQPRELLTQLIQNTKEAIQKLQEQLRLYEQALAMQDGRVSSANPFEKRKTVWEMAQEVLKKERNPTHVTTIAQKLAQEFDVTVVPKSLSQMLYAKSKARSGKGSGVFFKDKNTQNAYGLVEWQSQ